MSFILDQRITMRIAFHVSRTSTVAIIGLCVAVSCAAPAGAGDTSQTASAQQPKDWNVTVGGGLAYAPDYEGSNDYEFSPFPLVSASYKNYVFFEGMGLRANVLGLFADDLPVMAGPTISYGGGRKAKDNKALEKLGNIDGGLNLGAFAGTQLGPITLAMNLTKEVEKKRGGLTADFSLGYTQQLSEQFSANVGVNATWANRKYMQEYFGISTAQSVSSGYAVYDCRSGFKSVGVSAGLDYMWSEHISLGVGVGYTKLLKNAANSPIVKKQGSSDQYNASIYTSYTF
jgi:MipA family protein